MARLRLYADTSVIGGCEYKEFAYDSGRVVQGAKDGVYLILFSDVVLTELADAPKAVRKILTKIPPTAIERVPISDEVHRLREAYIEAGVVSRKSVDDATHVAAATVAQADAIVSWNFRHIVRLERIRGYNRINEAHGYRPLTIVSPTEVGYGKNDEEL